MEAAGAASRSGGAHIRHAVPAAFALLFGVALAGCALSRPFRSSVPDTATPPEERPFRFVQITDTHRGKAVHAWRFHEAIRQINALSNDVLFVLHTGDLASNGLHPDNAPLISNDLARLNYRVLAVPGNHDIIANEARRAQGAAAYTNFIGPLATSFTTNGVRILALNTEPLRKPGAAIEGYDPISWLRTELERDPLIPTIVAHHACDGPDYYNMESHPGWPAPSRVLWLDALARGNVVAIVCGHFHRDEMFWNELGIPTYVASSIANFWGRQGSYRIYTLERGRLSYHTVYLEDPAPEELPARLDALTNDVTATASP